jgi:hypothetical protein
MYIISVTIDEHVMGLFGWLLARAAWPRHPSQAFDFGRLGLGCLLGRQAT